MKVVETCLPLAVTCGDPAGVGPEIVAALLKADAGLAADCVVLGPTRWARELSEATGVRTLGCGDEAYVPEPGRPSEAGAKLALEAMERAAEGCRAGQFRAVVTGPVSKAWLQRVGYPYPGQTEFFAARWGGDPTMAFVGGRLQVVLATWHLPLSEVPAALTADCLRRAVERAHELGLRLGARQPRIGVCGLNPHAGEDGILGSEEIEVLDPLLDRMRTQMPGLSKCLPGDTVFFRQARGEFDVVVAAYHDQGLAALKTLEFDRAVNVTLGLPFVRTSPDHGTAFEIAGKARADPGSFLAAVSVARRLTDGGSSRRSNGNL
ncbi:MAG: 4-hydroxythreonine-4-phosphate dehydrogenase PdxA [Opitutales bacterium]